MNRRCFGGAALVPRFQLVEQVGLERPGVGTGGRRESKALEFAQAPAGGAFRGVHGFGIVDVDAAARAGHVGDVPVDWPDGPLRLARHGHDVARTKILGGPRVERDMERVARRRLDDGVQPSLELVGQPFARDTPRHDAGVPGDGRLECLPFGHDPVSGRVAAHGGVNLLQDVPARTQRAKLGLPSGLERPCRSRDTLREAHRFEVFEPRDQGRVLDPPGPPPRPDLDPVVDRPPLELAIERREPLLSDLPGVGASDVEIVARSELLGRDLLRDPAQAVRDEPAVESELAAAAVDAPEDDVRVGMIGVEMVDGQPLELAIEIALDPSHEAPDVRGEIELRRVLR